MHPTARSAEIDDVFFIESIIFIELIVFIELSSIGV